MEGPPPAKISCVRPDGKKSGSSHPPSKVLLVNVLNLLYPVDIDLLRQIFSKYGVVEKIVTFSKKLNQYQAMIQLDSIDNANLCINNLDGENIFNDCNTLRINYSSFQELTVKYNNAKTRDYTNPNLPPGTAGLAPDQQPTQTHAAVAALYGYDPATMAQYFDPSTYAATAGYGNGAAALHGAYGGMSQQIQLMLGGQVSNIRQTPVLFVNGLDESVTCDHLFNIFSFYGYVLRVKLLQSKQNSALLQFSDPLYSTVACHFLQTIPFGSVQLKVQFSNNSEVTMPAPSPDDAEKAQKMRSYTSEQQRFTQTNAQERYVKNACKPSMCLHVANLMPSIAESEIRELFQCYGRVEGFRMLPEKEGQTQTDGVRMALVNMSCSSEGTLALAHLHNHMMHGRSMKVSFTRQSFDGRKRAAE